MLIVFIVPKIYERKPIIYMGMQIIQNVDKKSYIFIFYRLARNLLYRRITSKYTLYIIYCTITTFYTTKQYIFFKKDHLNIFSPI